MKKFLCIIFTLIFFISSVPVSAGQQNKTGADYEFAVTDTKLTNNDVAVSDIKLNVSATQTVTVSEGTSAAVDVTITNNSDKKVDNVTAQAVIENPDKAYIDGDGYIYGGAVNIYGGSSERGSFSIRTESDFTSKTIPIKINLRYYLNGKVQDQSETIYVRVTAPEKPVNPAIEISKVDSVWVNKVDAGKEFQVLFEVKNTGDAVARNIKISINGLETGKITLANGLSTVDITALSPGDSQFVSFNLKTEQSAPGGTYMLDLSYSFTGEGDSTVDAGRSPKEGKYQFSMGVIKAPISQSSLEFKNITFPTGAVGRNQSVKISFDLVNTGKYTAENIKVTANSQDQGGLASKSVSQVNVKPLAPGKSAHFSFEFITTPAAETKNYPVEIKATYTDEKTTESSNENSQIVGVFVKAPKEKDPNAKDQSPVPKLIIEEYSFDPQIIEAGRPFKMYLKLYNTNANKNVRNIKIFLTSDIQESATGNSQDSANTSGPSPSSTASVFTPVGSSNTFYVDNIGPGKRVDKEITLTTVPDTAAKTYTVIANFEYEDAQANKYEATEQIGVPVVQQAKLEVGEIVPQSEFSTGMDTPLSVDFYNTGKATLYNVMVKITGKDLKFDTPTYYKGNFQPGSSDQFSVNINPESQGKKKITLEFTFEDSTGETQSIKRDYEFEVMDFEGMNFEEDFPVDKGGGFPFIQVIGAVVLIGAGVGTFLLIRKRKSQDDEDEDLEL